MRLLNLKRLSLALLIMLVLIILAACLLPASQSGSLWLLRQMPALQVEGFNGRLLGAWRAQRLTWQANGQKVVLSDMQMTADASCLLRLTFCVTQLKARQLDLHLPSVFTDKNDNEPLKLPSIRLPLISLELAQVQLGSLYLEANELLRDLNLTAYWRTDSIVVEQFSARQQRSRISLSGELQMRQDWPLSASVQLAMTAPTGEDGTLSLTAKGSLMDALLIQGQSQGWLNGQVKGRVQPLAAHLPLSLELQSEQPPLFGLPDNLQLGNLQIKAGGDLQAGYQLEVSASLPKTAATVDETPISIHLQGSVFSQRAEIKHLQLLASDSEQLTLAGTINWQPLLAAQLHLQGQDFPWQRLYPLEPLPLELRQIEADIQYGGAEYQGQFAVNLSGAGTDLSLSSPFQGNLKQINLNDLQLKTGAGGAQGRLDLQFAQTLAWQLVLTLHKFNPAFWLDELPGELSGQFDSQGRLQDGKLQASTAFDLNGKLRGQRAHLLAEGEGSADAWHLKQLKLQLGTNRLHGNASGAGEQLQADLTLNLPQLLQLWPTLSGNANGRIQVHGKWLQPQGTVQLSAQKLAFAEQSIGKLSIEGKFLADNGTLSVQASGIEVSGQRFSHLKLSASQRAAQQQLRGELQGEQLRAAFALGGQYQARENGWQWRGLLNQLSLGAYQQHWQLQAPVSVKRLADGQLSLAAHCLISDNASLCADNLNLLPQTRLSYRLQGFELASLKALLPNGFALGGRVMGELALDLSAASPQGKLHLASANGVLHLKEQDKKLDLPWQRFVLYAQLEAAGIDAALDFQSERLGHLSAKLQVNPNLADKPIRGQWRLQGFDLALVQPFVPTVSHLRGQLSSQGKLAGGLLAPQIEAELALKQAQIRGVDWPLDLHQLELTAQVRGEQMQLGGRFKSGEKGRAELAGQLSWDKKLSAKLTLKGEQLPIVLPPYANFQVFPDLTLHLAENNLVIDGNIKVPRGAIEIHSLPASVVRPSEDAQVLGREVKSSRAQNIGMNILLEVGSERVSFNGFGLTAELVGALQIGDNLTSQGELNLRGGRYRSYGQNLNVRRARLLFTGSLQQPFIDIEAVRQVDKVTAGLRISGLAEQPQTRIFAQPSMSDEQALSYLVLGKPLGSDSGSSNDLLIKAALGLGLTGGEALTERFGAQLGLSNFELGTKGSGDNTQVVVSGTLANRLSLSYGMGLFEPQGTIALRYQLTRSLYLEAASSLANSLDLLYRRDF